MAENKNKNLFKKSNGNPNEKPNGKFGGFNPNTFWIIGLIVGALFFLQFLNLGPSAKEITWIEFERNMLKKHEVEKLVVVNREKAEVYLNKSALKSGKYNKDLDNGFGSVSEKGPQFYFTIGSIEMLEKRLEKSQENFSEDQKIIVSYETRKDIVGDLMGWLLPIIILVVIWLFIFRRMGGGGAAGGGGNIFSIGKSKAKVFDKEENKVKTNFNDVAGLEEAKVEISEIVDFLKKPEKYTLLGGKIPKGALLVGPPGTGKTLLAKAVAGEANVPFFSLSGSDFVEMFVGVGASRVRDLFSQAKQKAPCIIFIDEIDAIGRARGKNPNMGSNDERENTLNQLLTEMDGFDTNAGVIILAATNRADILDPALLRAGRFDRQIHVEMPELSERREIFKVHMRDLKLSTNVDVKFLARQTPGFSGADIANICNEAALIAARKDKTIIEKQDFLDAVDRIIGGLERKSKVIKPSEKKRIAYHEAGHATVSWFSEHAHPLVKVTIVPRGRALGAAWYLPEERQLNTTEQMLDEMCAALGGRASEEIVLGTISSGALNDLEKVNKQAYAMVAYYGMSEKLKNISYFDSSGQNEYSFSKPYSDTTAVIIDQEAKKMVDEQYTRAISILSEKREGLNKLAEKLLEKEVIFTEDLVAIFGERPFKVEKIMENGNNSSPKLKEIKNEDLPEEIPEIKDSEDENIQS